MDRIGDFSVSDNELWLYHGDANFVEIPSNIKTICKFAFSGNE